VCIGYGVSCLTAPAVAEYPVAGTAPDQRLAGAPTTTSVVKPEGWYQNALTGLQPPYSHSFRFLEDQGNWYTPFTEPGMIGRYDIRGWHQNSK